MASSQVFFTNLHSASGIGNGATLCQQRCAWLRVCSLEGRRTVQGAQLSRSASQTRWRLPLEAAWEGLDSAALTSLTDILYYIKQIYMLSLVTVTFTMYGMVVGHRIVVMLCKVVMLQALVGFGVVKRVFIMVLQLIVLVQLQLQARENVNKYANVFHEHVHCEEYLPFASDQVEFGKGAI